MAKQSFLGQIAKDPAAQALLKSAKGFAAAKAGQTVNKLAQSGKISDLAGGGAKGGMVEGVVKAQDKGKLGKLWGGLKGGLKGLFKKGGSANKRPTNIVEDLFIALPADEVYEKWHDYSAHSGYTKGIVAVDIVNEAQDADEESGDEEQQEETNWKAKVWWSNRSWKATTVEDVPGQRIRWKTEGAKGTVDGVITFTALEENLTLVLIVIEYRPKGFMEWTANRWRTAGRRVRLDLKHFRRFAMMEESEESDEDEDQQDQDQTEQDDEYGDEADEEYDDEEEEDEELAGSRR
jgi:uncharacterized membrane protein